MNTIAAWFKSKNWTTKGTLAAAGSLAVVIASTPAIQEWIKTTLAAHPQLASLIVLASIAFAQQNHSSSPAGTLATARIIIASPDAPTSAQVDAASTK